MLFNLYYVMFVLTTKNIIFLYVEILIIIINYNIVINY